MRFIDAIHSGLECSLKEHDNLIFMGQDIADYGGVFKATDTFLEKFGKERIINTPLCESAIVGVGVGLSVYLVMVAVLLSALIVPCTTTCGTTVPTNTGGSRR